MAKAKSDVEEVKDDLDEELDDIVDTEEDSDDLDEELDDLEESEEEESEDIADEEEKQVPAEKSKATPPAKKSAFDLSKVFANVPGVVCGDIGLELQRFPVEKIRFTTTSRSLISIVSGQVLALKTHFSDDLGSIICFGGQCCEDMGLASVRYVFPVVEYDVNKKGVPVSTELKYKCLITGKDTYENILSIKELQGDITKVDLVVTCTDEGYQKISISMAGPARWRKSKASAKQTVDFWREHMKDIILPVGKQMTEEEYIKRMGSTALVGNDVTDAELEEMFRD